MVQEVSVNGARHTCGLLEHHVDGVLDSFEQIDRCLVTLVVIAEVRVGVASLRLECALELLGRTNDNDRVEQVQVGQLAVGALDFQL